jgi:hypothetical protein
LTLALLINTFDEKNEWKTPEACSQKSKTAGHFERLPGEPDQPICRLPGLTVIKVMVIRKAGIMSTLNVQAHVTKQIHTSSKNKAIP